MKDNPVILDGCSPDLVIDLSGRELESFNYPLDPAPSGAIGSIESFKGFEGELGGVRKNSIVVCPVKTGLSNPK